MILSETSQLVSSCQICQKTILTAPIFFVSLLLVVYFMKCSQMSRSVQWTPSPLLMDPTPLSRQSAPSLGHEQFLCSSPGPGVGSFVWRR